MYGVKFLHLTGSSIESGYARYGSRNAETWALGVWKAVNPPVIPCENGFHFFTDGQLAPTKGYPVWSSKRSTGIALVEVRGRIRGTAGNRDECGKSVASEMRILAVWKVRRVKKAPPIFRWYVAPVGRLPVLALPEFSAVKIERREFLLV